MGQALLTFESPSQKVMGLVCADLHGSAFNSMATSNLTDRDVTEHTSVAASDTHSTEDEDISVQSDSATGDSTNTNFTQWTDNTNCPTVQHLQMVTDFAV